MHGAWRSSPAVDVWGGAEVEHINKRLMAAAQRMEISAGRPISGPKHGNEVSIDVAREGLCFDVYRHGSVSLWAQCSVSLSLGSQHIYRSIDLGVWTPYGLALRILSM